MESSGLRDRKKTQTRDRITQVAYRAFVDRGFDAVTVTQIAAAAEVSPATVFNYFPTKEDIVFSGMVSYEARLVHAVSSRPSEQSLLDAFRDFITVPGGLLAEDDPAAASTQLAAAARMIAASSALRERELALYDRHTSDLAAIAEDAPEVPAGQAWVVANALIGVGRAMTATVRQMAIEGTDARTIASHVVTRARAALDLLETGLARVDPGHRGQSSTPGHHSQQHGELS